MSYFLKKTTPSKKGIYLQIYESRYVPGKGKRNRSYRALGYLSDLIEKGIPDPVAYGQDMVDRLNKEERQSKAGQIGTQSLNKNIGYFLPKAMFDFLDMDGDIDYASSSFCAGYVFSDMLRALCYAQITEPECDTYEKIIPKLYKIREFSHGQISEAMDFIGLNCRKYTEILNRHIENRRKRKTDKVYCYCSEFFSEAEDKNGSGEICPGKSLSRYLILRQVLMLDAEEIPIDMELFPGNGPDTTSFEEKIRDMKARNDIQGRVILVGEKDPDCIDDICADMDKTGCGYIFLMPLKGLSFSRREKERILEDFGYKTDGWTFVKDDNGDLLCRYKEEESTGKDNRLYSDNSSSRKYKPGPSDTEKAASRVNGKRIVIYDPLLAARQREEIYDRAETAVCADKNGTDEDQKLTGYAMMVTSESDAVSGDIIRIYDNLRHIEESFLLTESRLEAKLAPLTLNTISGHFFICYLALAVMRLLELCTFKNEIPVPLLCSFIRQYNVVVDCKNGDFINASTMSETFLKIKKTLGLDNLGNAYLSQEDINRILNTDIKR